MGDFGSPTLSFPPLGTDRRGAEAFGTPPLGTFSSAHIDRSRHNSPRISSQEAPEVARRAAEWERQIETLDQKEMEIHQTQLRLIREQTATFRADLLALRQEVVDLKGLVTKHAAMHGETVNRISVAERGLQDFSDSLGKHGGLFQDVDRKLQQISGSINEHHRVIQRNVSTSERLDYLEKAVGDSADKHARAIEDAQAKLEALHGRLSANENGHNELKRVHADKEIKHATLAERLGYLEKITGDSAEKHRMELEAFRNAHDKTLKDTGSRHASLEQMHASTQSRLNFLESMIGDSADKHAKELEAVRASVGQLGSGSRLSVSGVQGAATVAERLAFLEQAVGDSADKHQAELQAAHSKLDRMGSHGETLDTLKRGHQEFQKNLMAYSASHATQNDRITYIEKILGDSAEKHSREIDALKQAHNKLVADNKGHAQNHGSVSDKIDAVLKSHATVEDRIGYIERTVGDVVDKHAREITNLKTAHNSHQAGGKELTMKHASMEDRIDHLEKTLGDSADKHAAVLSAIQVKQEQLVSKLSDHDKIRAKHEGELNLHKDRLMQHHATVEERLDFIEKTIGDSADKHLRELDHMKGAHAKLIGEGKEVRMKHASLEERLDYVENWFRGFKPR